MIYYNHIDTFFKETRTTMRIYEYNESDKTLNTECGLPLYLSEHEIDDMCRVEKS